MTRHDDPMRAALREGKSYTWTLPDGGDLASMRNALRHGQTLTISPVADPAEIRAGDLVLVQWHQSDIFHIVGEIQDGRYRIDNSLGKVNGWVGAGQILGRITRIVDPLPHPAVEEMTARLRAAFGEILAREQSSAEDAARLLGLVDSLEWYAQRLGPERADVLPRQNRWSFVQNLWHLLRMARGEQPAAGQGAVYWIDYTTWITGLAAEAALLFEGQAGE